jgi:hypothetical protein
LIPNNVNRAFTLQNYMNSNPNLLNLINNLLDDYQETSFFSTYFSLLTERNTVLTPESIERFFYHDF